MQLRLIKLTCVRESNYIFNEIANVCGRAVATSTAYKQSLKQELEQPHFPAMSRHRGVVRSDDEEQGPASSTRSNMRPSKPHKSLQRQSEPLDPALLELPNLAVLTNERAQAIREPDRQRERLAKAVDRAMAVISDSAVAVEDVSDVNSEVRDTFDRERELTQFD
jgi:hypothetical protein